MHCITYYFFIDGLDMNWKEGGISNWEGSYSNSKHISQSFAFQRLNTPQLSNTHASEDVHRVEQIPNDYGKYTVDGKRVVARMPLYVFQDFLVENFDIRFKNKDTVWPTRFNSPKII